MLRLKVVDRAAADAIIKAGPKETVDVKVSYTREGLAGVPTFMDWDGCVGAVKVLLQK